MSTTTRSNRDRELEDDIELDELPINSALVDLECDDRDLA